MNLKEILERVEDRLKAVGLTANGASELAGKTDAVRNLRRAVEDGRTGMNIETIAALADPLGTTIAWLLEGAGVDSITSHEADLVRLFRQASPDIQRMVETILKTAAQK